MTDFAQKLITAAQKWSSDVSPSTPNPIITAARIPQKSLVRIGLWPITSSLEPEISMGIGVVLAALLEQWSSVCVYRLMTRVSSTPSHYKWKIEDTQFGVDDWEIGGLDENVAIWGNFESENDHFRLSIEVEDDAREDNSVFELKYDAATLVEILNQLPVLAAKIMSWLNETSSNLQSPYEVIGLVDPLFVESFLEDVFLWELDYFLELWGQGSSINHILTSQNNLIEISNELDCDFGAWVMSQSIVRFIVFDQTRWSECLLPTVAETAHSLDKYPIAANTLATAMSRFNGGLEAYDILESSLAVHPEDSKTWIALGELYEKSGENLSAIDVYQRAIEANAGTTEIYLRYASLIDSLVEHQIELRTGSSRVSRIGRPFIERYVFTDSSADALSLRESCAAYRHVIELDPSNVDALAHLVVGLLSLHDPEAWPFCIQLIDRDKEGAVTASIIEQLVDDDMPRMVNILQTASTKHPQELSLRLNLVRMYLALGQMENAKRELNTVSINDVPSQFLATFTRLHLSVDDPDFEARLGEIKDVLNAKSQVTTEDSEFLEAAIEKEPLFSEGYRLLAQSYLSWNEPDDALEVLLDGHKTAPFDPELVALLAKVLWDADEPDLAFAYLNQGLNNNSHNTTLLSLMGRFLFDNGEDESAKEYLRRAEAVDPLNSELSATRLYVANMLIKNKKT